MQSFNVKSTFEKGTKKTIHLLYIAILSFYAERTKIVWSLLNARYIYYHCFSTPYACACSFVFTVSMPSTYLPNRHASSAWCRIQVVIKQHGQIQPSGVNGCIQLLFVISEPRFFKQETTSDNLERLAKE